MIYIALLLILCAIIFFVFLITFAILVSLLQSDFKGSPFINNNRAVITEAISLLNLNSSDSFVDLGCGSGFVVKHVIETYPKITSVCGVEVSLLPYLISKFVIRSSDKDKVKIIRSDINKYDFSKFNKVYLYLLPELLATLSPKISKLCNNDNFLCVSCVFPIDGLNSIKVSSVYHPTFKKQISIFLYGKKTKTKS